MLFKAAATLALLGAAPLVSAYHLGAPYIHDEAAVGNKNWKSTNPQVKVQGSTCTVSPLGGGRDDGPAINYAFQLCSQDAKVVLDKAYTVDSLLYSSLQNVEIEFSGFMQYTPDIPKWSNQSLYLVYQNSTTAFALSGTNVTMRGGGTIDGSGQVWWNAFAANRNAGVAGGSSRTFARPIPLAIVNSQNVWVDNVSIVNSPFWHSIAFQSSYVTLSNIYIHSISYNASVPAANSDGIDIYRSDHVTISNWEVHNDDDTVSFKPNSTNILVENVWSNGSHGISVGSLGQYSTEVDIVENVLVRNATLMNAQNGARIKLFPGAASLPSISGGGSGYVRNVTYQDIIVDGVDNPIIVTTCYNSKSAYCEAHPTNMTLSDIHFINVSGTASKKAGDVVASIACSAPCSDIYASNIDIATYNGTTPVYDCANIADESLLSFKCTEVAI